MELRVFVKHALILICLYRNLLSDFFDFAQQLLTFIFKFRNLLSKQVLLSGSSEGLALEASIQSRVAQTEIYRWRKEVLFLCGNCLTYLMRKLRKFLLIGAAAAVILEVEVKSVEADVLRFGSL